ncbi:MAG: phosphatase PAP2 family protein [Methylocystis sp.]
MKLDLLLAASLAVLSISPALARDAVFVSPDQSHTFQILPTPPAADSDTTKAELAELHRIEATRTEAEIAQAKFDDENENIFLFKNVMGDKFTKDNLPLTAAFAARVRGDEGVNTEAAKVGFHRIRPYNLDKTLHPVCKVKAKDDAYPSGHATSGYLLALTLIDMIPEKRDAILARAEEYGHNRLVCGVHYSTDVPASKLLAYTIHAIMEVSPQYQKELAVAKAELRQALGLDIQDAKK